jgi:hypothetical protein
VSHSKRNPKDFLTKQELRELSTIEWKLNNVTDRLAELKRHPLWSLGRESERLLKEQTCLLNARARLLDGREYSGLQVGQGEAAPPAVAGILQLLQSPTSSFGLARQRTEETPVNSFRVGLDNWTVAYAGNEQAVLEKPTNGIRAIAYLLKTKTPTGGAKEVRTVMAGGDPVEVGRTQSADVPDAQVLKRYRAEIEDIEDHFSAADEGHINLSKEARQECEKKANHLKRELERWTDRTGKIRLRNRDAQTVGKAIQRALSRIKRLDSALGKHLDDSIKVRFGAEVRYAPDKPVAWEVEGV